MSDQITFTGVVLNDVAGDERRKATSAEED